MTHDPTAMEAMFNSLDDTYESGRQDEYLHPPVNLMGNKFGQLDFILPLLPWHETYVEVFGGSGAVLLSKNKSKFEVFNDRFSGSVALYRCIQDHKLLDELIGKIECMPHAREFFAACRDTWKDDDDLVSRAAKWYHLVQASFAGRAEFFGRVTKGNNNIPNKIRMGLPLFPSLHDRLKSVQIENLDYKKCLKDFDSPSTLFYLDPPYYGADVYASGFTKKDHIELCKRIFDVEGAVVMSGYENPIYDEFGWDAVHINHAVDNRCTTMAFTEGNHMENREGTIERGVRKEYVWIKEAYE